MRLWVLSDLHTAPDAPWFPSVRPEFDALVIAGDVYDSDIERSILWTAQVADGRPAVFVPGNHEFWGRTIEDELERAERRAQKEGVTLLNGQGWMAVAGGHFAGGTLWTDLELNQPAGHILYPREFGDPIDVRGPGIDRRAKGRDIARRHRAEVDVLEAILDPDVAPEGPRIVVTHYAPHIEVLPDTSGISRQLRRRLRTSATSRMSARSTCGFADISPGRWTSCRGTEHESYRTHAGRTTRTRPLPKA